MKKILFILLFLLSITIYADEPINIVCESDGYDGDVVNHVFIIDKGVVVKIGTPDVPIKKLEEFDMIEEFKKLGLSDSAISTIVEGPPDISYEITESNEHKIIAIKLVDDNEYKLNINRLVGVINSHSRIKFEDGYKVYSSQYKNCQRGKALF